MLRLNGLFASGDNFGSAIPPLFERRVDFSYVATQTKCAKHLGVAVAAKDG